jgi:uncharacterized protein YbaR (Trm112 family)
MAVPAELMEMLRCLECRSTLEENDGALICSGCDLHYPVEGDIPVMLRDAAYRKDDDR